MLKNIVKLEFMIADKVYHFLCDNDSPIEHLKEAIFQMQRYIGQIEDNAKAQLAAQKEAEEKKPEDDQKVEG
jgi:hypothetical protein